MRRYNITRNRKIALVNEVHFLSKKFRQNLLKNRQSILQYDLKDTFIMYEISLIFDRL